MCDWRDKIPKEITGIWCSIKEYFRIVSCDRYTPETKSFLLSHAVIEIKRQIRIKIGWYPIYPIDFGEGD
jgi:hypothetical protein